MSNTFIPNDVWNVIIETYIKGCLKYTTFGGFGGWNGEPCDDCGTWIPAGKKCPKCAPPGLVICPYKLGPKHNITCSACKGTGFVEEL